jgi:hypothetical protein
MIQTIQTYPTRAGEFAPLLALTAEDVEALPPELQERVEVELRWRVYLARAK